MISFDFSQLEGMVSDLRHDTILLEKMVTGDSFLRALELIVIENFDRVFDTEGSNIGENWDGNSLVDSGRLKVSLTSVGEIGIQVSGDTIIFSSDVPYSSDVNNKYSFYGVDSEFNEELSALVTEYLNDKGKIDWE